MVTVGICAQLVLERRELESIGPGLLLLPSPCLRGNYRVEGRWKRQLRSAPAHSKGLMVMLFDLTQTVVLEDSRDVGSP